MFRRLPSLELVRLTRIQAVEQPLAHLVPGNRLHCTGIQLRNTALDLGRPGSLNVRVWLAFK